MIYLQSYGLAFLELTFILVAIMLLHSLKRVIGNAAFYLALGTVMVLAQFMMATGLTITVPAPITGLSVTIGPAIFFTPFLAALLVTYIVDGTLEAQRLIWGMVALVGLFAYLVFLAEKQAELPGFAARLLELPVDSRTDVRGFMATFYQSARWFMLASLLSLLVEFLVLPVAYEVLRNLKYPLWFSVLGALVFTEVLDAFFFELVTNFEAPSWWDALRASYLARVVSLLWVGCLVTVYLRMRDAAKSHAASTRRPEDIVVAFLGGYGQAERMQGYLREWEGRYRMVVETTNDLVFIVAEDGAVLDANRQALSSTGYAMGELLALNIQQLLGAETAWPALWDQLLPPDATTETELRKNVVVNECQLRTAHGEVRIIEAVISPIVLRGHFAALLVGRDITRRKKLEREREALQEKLIHAQRMEAVGQLAAGVAHDFNNLLHAIQGSLEILERNLDQQEGVTQPLHNIAAATTRAGTLIGQLLGFARAGKYEVRRIEVSHLVRETEALLRPTLRREVELRVVMHPDPMFVEGDFTQLEQALFNILRNAAEALPAELGGRVVCRAEPGSALVPGWRPEVASQRPGVAFVVIRVRDNGCGMDEETMKLIFEPFFTANKPGGTGMGLAMVYGCVENHHGWVHVDSAPGKGTEFAVFLPRVT